MESMFALESLYILDEPAEYTATYEELLEQTSALESFADSLEDELFVYSAMEATSDDDIDTTASEISAKYRSGFEKIKKGKRTKNQKLVSEGQREVNEASDDLKEAEKNANTAEKKAKLRKVAKIAIAVGGAVLLALLAYVGIKNRSRIVGAIRKLKKNPGSNVAQTISEVKNAASTAASTPVEEKPIAPVSDGEQSIHQQLSDVKQQVGKSISDRHEAAQKEINAALKEIYSDESEPEILTTATVKSSGKSERQLKADKIRADRARKRELKNWAVAVSSPNRDGSDMARTKEDIEKNLPVGNDWLSKQLRQYDRRDYDLAFTPEGKREARTSRDALINYRSTGHDASERYQKKVAERFKAYTDYREKVGKSLWHEMTDDEKRKLKELEEKFYEAVRLRDNATKIR